MNEEIIQNLNERLDTAIERGKKVLEDEDLQHRIDDLKFRTEDTVRRNPLKSIAVGFAAGFLLAKIFNSDD